MKINLPVSTDNKSCVPGLSEQEELFFLALNNATTYRISGNTMTIPYDDNKQDLVFESTQLEVAERPPMSTLNGTNWYLWYMNNTPVLSGTSIYAAFTINPDGASGTMSGYAGCNNYVASFGNDMGVQTTLNAHQQCCQPIGIMEQEGTYMNMLSRAYGYWLTGDQLILNTGQGVLTYRGSKPAESADQTHLLVEKTWYLVSYNNTYSLAGAQEPYTLFKSDGTLSGYSGCNSYQGTYTTNIHGITVGNLNSTQEARPSTALDAQQQVMFAILNSVKSYQAAETVMQVTGDAGVLNYSLTPINRPEEIEPPQARIEMPAEANVNQVVTFNGTESFSEVPIIAWNWDFGDGGTGSGEVVDNVYNNPGTYRVELIVTDQRGYQDSEVMEINIAVVVEPTPPPTQPPPPTPTQAPQPTPTAEPTEAPVTPPQASIQGSGQGYVGEPISFDASASVAGSSPITRYRWNFGDVTSAGPSPDPYQTMIYTSLVASRCRWW